MTEPAATLPAALYLLPVPLSEGTAGAVLPAHNLQVLRSLEYFVVENVRSARRFLRAACPGIAIDPLHFEELSEHTPPGAVDALLAPLLLGHPIGVLSEAGCPAVADPGADLVAAAQRRHLPVVPLVGPSSIIMGLMGSGFNGQQFTFMGYLPIDAAPRAAALRDIARRATAGHTSIFIETPYRNNRLIAELAQKLPAGLKLCVASDITGPAQSIVTLPVVQWRTRSYDYNKIPTIFLVNG